MGKLWQATKPKSLENQRETEETMIIEILGNGEQRKNCKLWLVLDEVCLHNLAFDDYIVYFAFASLDNLHIFSCFDFLCHAIVKSEQNLLGWI